MDVDGLSVIKEFISSVKEYNKQKTGTVTRKLQRCLQILSNVTDNNIFDPKNEDGANFYVSLYELMYTLDSKTGLMWCAVSVLEEASKNPAAQHALTHTYKFTPILTQLLNGHLIYEKQIQVLKLLQEFTYGVKILWQDSNLPLLISILIKWINENDKSSEILSLSLGILVNLCYKNLPAIYVLRRVIDIKSFIRSILTKVKDVLDIRVQAYKLLIILEEISGEMSENGIISCVAWIFKRMYECIECGNVNAMRHVVDFFKDIMNHDNFKYLLTKYESYGDDTNKLLSLLETKLNDVNYKCVSLVFEFLNIVILLHPKDIEGLCLPIVQLTLRLIKNTHINQFKFNIISSVLAESIKNDRKIYSAVIYELNTALNTILSLFNDENAVLNSKTNMAAFLGLLLELSKDDTTCENILYSLQPHTIRNYFSDILVSNSSENNLFDETSTLFYLQGLLLVTSLSVKHENWRPLFTELIQHKIIKMNLAASFYSRSPQIKLLGFNLIAQLGNDSRLLMELAHGITDVDKFIGPAVGINNLNGLNTFRNDTLPNENQNYHLPLLNLSQQRKFDDCIESVNQAISNNQLNGIGTAAVFELYEYKVAALTHRERILLKNLDEVDHYSTNLRHHYSIMLTKTNKLLMELHSKEESLKSCQSTMSTLRNDIIVCESSMKNLQNICNQNSEEIKNKNEEIAVLSKDLSSTRASLKEKELENSSLSDQFNILKDKMNSKCKEFEEHSRNMEADLVLKEKSIKELNSVVLKKEKKIEQKELFIKDLEKVVCSKDDEIVKYQAEIAELEDMLENIQRVSEKIRKRGNANSK